MNKSESGAGSPSYANRDAREANRDAREANMDDREANMDDLLGEFFDKEMPAELRRFSAKAVLAPASSDAGGIPRTARRKSGWLKLTVIAGCLLMVAVVLSLPASKPARDSAPETPVAASEPTEGESAEKAAPASLSAVRSEVDVTVTEAVERYDTVNGPVEQRSKLRIRNISIYDLQTGSKVEVMLPELDIEIFPIKDDEEPNDDDEKNEVKED